MAISQGSLAVHASRRHPDGSWAGLVMPGVFVMLILAGMSARRAAAQDVDPRLRNSIDAILSSTWADDTTHRSLSVLTDTLSSATSAVPASLTVELRESLATHLERLKTDMEQYESARYKSALAAQRVLEMSEGVYSLQHRAIAADEALRKKARRQYQDLAQGLQDYCRTQAGAVHPQAMDQVVSLVLPVFDTLQWDVLSPGFGQPLDDRQYAECVTKLEKAVDAVAALAAQYGRENYAREHKNAAFKVAVAIAEELRAMGRSKEGQLSEKQKEAFDDWCDQHLEVLSAVHDALDQATLEERRLESAKEEAERQARIREGDPRLIEMRAMATEALRGAPLLEDTLLEDALTGSAASAADAAPGAKAPNGPPGPEDRKSGTSDKDAREGSDSTVVGRSFLHRALASYTVPFIAVILLGTAILLSATRTIRRRGARTP